jgi:hypothetical protein
VGFLFNFKNLEQAALTLWAKASNLNSWDRSTSQLALVASVVRAPVAAASDSPFPKLNEYDQP